MLTGELTPGPRLRTRTVGPGALLGMEEALAGESRWFLNMAAGGFAGAVSEKAGKVKDRWGPLAYLRAAVGTLPELQGFAARITLDGGEPLAVEAYNVVVSNGRFVAGGIPVAPQSRLDDGLLDLMVVPSASIPQLALLLPQVLLGLAAEHPEHLAEDALAAFDLVELGRLERGPVDLLKPVPHGNIPPGLLDVAPAQHVAGVEIPCALRGLLASGAGFGLIGPAHRR